ncbi:MAG: rhomboid family intramembrane serine protease [Flavobacteriales bacterium]|nr:rhomboid family intramembrane serine protease [Flavobacteriales bacterium]
MTIPIVVATCIVSIMAFKNREIFNKSMFVPHKILNDKEWYRLVSHGLIHADWMHLGFNMFALFMFGKAVEHHFGRSFGSQGTFYFILLYIGGIAFASLRTLQKEKDNYMYSSVGASGAVSAVVMTSVLFEPWQNIYIYFIEVPGIIGAAGFIAYSVYMGKKNVDNINHDAHLWGALFGITFPIILDYTILTDFFNKLF